VCVPVAFASVTQCVCVPGTATKVFTAEPDSSSGLACWKQWNVASLSIAAHCYHFRWFRSAAEAALNEFHVSAIM
jgi:hypothetical protein